MDAVSLLEEMGYAESPHFLKAETSEFESTPYFGHIFRHAKENLPEKLASKAKLLGVYTIGGGEAWQQSLRTPFLYVCQVDDPAVLPELHRLIWCQDVVPFVLVHTPKGLQLHSGFQYVRANKKQQPGILEPLRDFNQCQALISEFSSDSIDSGRVWQNRRADVKSESRVDWKLLKNLKRLDERLRNMGLDRESSHALIGKYVFLNYLKDREILSDRKLEGWGLRKEEIFGSKVTVKGLRNCLDSLEDWLNGNIFPIHWSGKDAPKAEHVRAVAATFDGDEPRGSEYWQLSLDFEVYDFSFIPIETLSVIYEQFLHAPDEKGKRKGRQQGAYYTPIPLVNLMIAQLEERRPLSEGMRILDPSCGSGAFLVQAYRRLIEKTYPPEGKRPAPRQLRELLIKSIFGIDRDEDACSVTELSLQMTLLDCVEPPDLEAGAQQRFQLPSLRDSNIIHADLFDEDSDALQRLKKKPFDVILGNPPWKSLNPKKLDEADEFAWKWIKDHGLNKKSETPVSDHQLAQAFVWKLRDFSNRSAIATEVAFLLPAMTLFDNNAELFRSRFFARNKVSSIFNFANMRRILFGGRTVAPSAAIFFHINTNIRLDAETPHIRVVSPFLANQESNRPDHSSRNNNVWSIEIHEDEFRDVDYYEALSGSGLPWKAAQWGSHLDLRLLSRLQRRFPSLSELEKRNTLLASEGLQLRRKTSGEELIEVWEVVGKPKLDVNLLKRLRNVFRFPEEAISDLVPEEQRFVRKRGGLLPLKVCRPPHIIVSAARTFAVYSDEYLVVPARQIGICHVNDNKQSLKALSLYLSSDFAFYHQCFTSSEFGVERDRATLKSLREIPVPLSGLTESALEEWERLHSALATLEPTQLKDWTEEERSLYSGDSDQRSDLLRNLNDMVFDALGLSQRERALVTDFCQVRFALNDGKIGPGAVNQPSPNEMRRYASRLTKELNSFVGDLLDSKYQAEVVFDNQSGMVALDLAHYDEKNSIKVRKADHKEAKELAMIRQNLQQEYSQWVYLNRNLRIYNGTRTYILKPMQRFHWTESQAMADAAELISETMHAEAIA